MTASLFSGMGLLNLQFIRLSVDPHFSIRITTRPGGTAECSVIINIILVIKSALRMCIFLLETTCEARQSPEENYNITPSPNSKRRWLATPLGISRCLVQ